MKSVLRAAPAWAAALLWGAFVPAAIFTVAAQTPALMPIALGITFLHALAALPIAFLFWWRRWMRFAVAAIAGFVIGAIPMGLLLWPDEPTQLPHNLLVAVGFGLLGSSGASAFWGVLRLAGALSPTGPTAARPGAILAVLGLCAFIGCFVFL
jgi:hypothetical protein